MISGRMQSARDSHALLLAAGKLSRIFRCLFRDAHLLEVTPRRGLRLSFGDFADQHRRKRAVFEHRHVWEEVEVLEHHAHFASDCVDIADVVVQLGAEDVDAAGIVFLKAIDAADHGRLARAGGAANDDLLATTHG
jgi:hypothetical protein